LKLALVRSGGVAGMPRRAIVTPKPGSEQETEMRRLVQAANLGGYPEPTIRTGPDRLLYTLSVEDGDVRHSILFDEERTPESFRPLMEAILRHARKDEDDPDITRV
jgi:hypothetical protein